jgi:hypothetical protein
MDTVSALAENGSIIAHASNMTEKVFINLTGKPFIFSPPFLSYFYSIESKFDARNLVLS